MEYAQTRMQARHGARPDEALWRRLGEQRRFADYLAAARPTALGVWLAGIDEAAGLHEIERALRQRWRESVGELARWLPPEWHDAVLWAAPLVDLPVIAHLAQGGKAPGWLARDVAAAKGAPDWHDRASWFAGWRARWPAAEDGDEAASLRGLAAEVEEHLTDFAGLDAGAAWEARRAFAEGLRRAFRLHAARPTAAFVYLLLLALDLERLRGELVGRVVHRRHAS
jgi:hypothetical protein